MNIFTNFKQYLVVGAILGCFSIITATDVKLNGTAFGTSPAWNNGTDTYDKASDGNTGTFFDYANANGGYTGIDLGSGDGAKITSIRYFPRAGFLTRMVGGKFQGSITSSSSGFVDLYTITAAPTEAWQTATITDQTIYRYLRYLAPDGGFGNVAEIEFRTTANVPPTIATQPVNQNVDVGQAATFSLVAAGTPPFSYQWKKGSSIVPGAIAVTYTTPSTTSADNGSQFSCEVSNYYGTVMSNAATLTVNSSPTSSWVGTTGGVLYTNASVGIGTTTTGTCKLAIDGKIAAREVIVTQATSWPDYVFKAGFNLKPLAEVEKQIKKDGHLEGIPSAAEVEKNGVQVGEMQAKLLQKVEELTLHMIAMDKINTMILQENALLKEQIAQQQK